MADFNLSAAISLQLADKAVANLKKDIQKGFNVPLELDAAGAVKKGVKKAQKEADNSPIVVPIIFKDIDEAKLYKSVEKKLKPFELKVQFSKDSIKENLTSEKLQAMMTKPPKVLIDVAFGPKTKAELLAAQKDVDRLLKAAGRLQRVINKNNKSGSTGPVSAPAVSTTGKKSKIFSVSEDATESIKQLTERTKELDKLNRDVFGKSNAYGGGFYRFAKKEIDALKKELLSLDKVAQRKIQPIGKISGSSLIAAKFSGLDESSKGNFLQSLKIMFGTLTKLEDKEQELIATSKKVGPAFDLTKATASLAGARQEIAKLFLSLASGDPSTFSNSVTSEFRKADQSINEFVRSSTRGLRDYERLLTSLELKQKTADLGNAGLQVKQNIKNLIDEVKAQKGTDVDAIKNSDAFKDKNALLGHLRYVDQEAKKAEASIDSLNRKMSLGELKKTELGKYFDVEGQTKAIGARAAKGVAGTNDPNEIKKFTDIAKQEANALQTRVSDLTRQYKRLTTQAEIFESVGYQKGADSLRNFTTEFLRLANAGNSIESIDNAVTRTIANATNTKGLDVKIERTIQKIQRLRDTIEASGGTDVSGVGKQLKDFEDSLTGRKGKFSGLTASSLDKGAATSFFDIKGAQKMNDMIDTMSSKMKHIGKFSDNLGIEDIYTKGAAEFEKGANSIVNNSDRVGKKIRDLKALGENVLAKAKFDSEGGFFGSIAKSAGLAAKRLGAFLILAQGLYTVQSFFTSALQEAVELDKQFVRLEQVFNKDLTGSALVSSLENVQAKILNLGKTLGVTSIEVANAAQVLAQAGIGGKNLIDLLDVVAKSELGPSFGSATETAEASIAIMRQFGLTVEQTTEALGGINRVSAKYAVEAKGITEAVRRAGGVFATSGDKIDSFAAAFTIVKQQTREADEAIATGLRNIAQRLQSSKIQEKLKAALGIDLVENDAFVGFEESIIRIGKALKSVGAGENSPLFAEIREIIGGQRQGGRVTPLLQGYEDFEKLRKEFGLGAKSIEEDVAVAFQSIENKIERAKGAIKELYTEIIRSDFVKFLVEGFTQITTFASGLLRALNSVPGAIFAIGTAAKVLGNSKFVTQTFLGQIAPRVALPFQKNKGGAIALNTGGASDGLSGLIPGGGPNKDSLLAYLTTGEYVLQRKAVKKYGTTFLDNLNDGVITANSGGPIKRNSGGIIPGFVDGGLAEKVKSFIPKSINKLFTNFFSAGSNSKPKPLDISDLQEDLSSLGLSIKDLDKYVEQYTKNSAFGPGTGSFDPDSKTLGIASGSSKGKLLPHEIGHSLYDSLPKNSLEALRLAGSAPLDSIKYTQKRLKGNPKFYPNTQSGQGGQLDTDLLSSEIFADAFAELTHFKNQSFAKQQRDPRFREMNEFRNKIKKTGIDVGFEGEDLARANSKSTIAKILSQGAGEGYGKKTASKTNPLTDAQIQGKRDRATNTFRHRDGILGRLLGKFGENRPFSGSGGGIAPATTGGLKRFKYRAMDSSGLEVDDIMEAVSEQIAQERIRDAGFYVTKIREIKSSQPKLGGGFGKLLFGAGGSDPKDRPDKGIIGNFLGYGKHKSLGLTTGGSSGGLGKGFKSLTTSVLNTKGGLVGLGTAAFFLTGVLGQFSQGLSELVLAMTAASSTFLASASAGASINYARNLVGKGPKQNLAARAAAIASGHKEKLKAAGIATGVSKARFSVAAYNSPTVAASGITAAKIAAIRGNSGAAAAVARATAQQQGTKAILANIRASAPAAGSFTKVAKSGAAAAALKASGVPAAAAAKALSGKLTVAAIGVGVLFGALDYFIQSVKKGADDGFANAETLKEAQAVRSKSRLAGVLQDPLAKTGTIVGAALTGASIGGAPGLLIGAVIGGLVAFKDPINDAFKSALPGIHDIVVNKLIVPLKEGLSNLLTDVSDTLYALTNGTQALAAQKATDLNDFKLIRSAKRLDSNKRLGKPVELSDDTLIGISTDLKLVNSLINQVGGGDFNNLSQVTQEELKGKVQRDADVFNKLGPEEQARAIANFKAIGYDFEKIAKIVGVELNYVENKAAAAFDSLSIFFENMKQIVDLSSSRLDGLSGGLGALSDSKNNNLFAPTELLDIKAAGYDPKTLGFGTFDQSQQNTNALIRGFDPRLADSLNFENKTKSASRGAQQAILGNQNIKIEKDQINEFLADIFDVSSNGDIDANRKFDEFLQSKFEDVNAAINADGTIDVTKVNALFQEFSDAIGSAASDQAKKIINLSNQYYDSYKKQLSERFALEAEANEFIKSNVDKDKASFDIANRSKGLTGDALAQARGQQGVALDASRLGTTLQGTGLGGQATVAQMSAALLASQQRQQQAGAVANAAIAVSPNDPAAAVKATRIKAETEAVEEDRQRKLKAGLSLEASGATEGATRAMEEFERAIQRATTSSKFLSDSLLGSDDQLMATVKGITALATIESAFNQGGVGAARGALLGLDETSRQAVNQRISQDSELQGKFNQYIGATPNIQAGPEAAAAEAAVQRQREANLGLAAAITDSINPIIANTTRLQTLYESQFQGLQGVVAQAQATSQALVGQIAALPQVIKHEANVNVNVIGADKAKVFVDAIQPMFELLIDDMIDRAMGELKKQNKGLN